MSKSKLTCNQCHTRLGGSLLLKDDKDVNTFIGFCTNPACPSYALLQIAAEQMPAEKEKKWPRP
jgi:hypothetical protein